MSWEMVSIGKFCDLKNGYAFKSTDYIESSNTLNCRMSNIRPGGYFDLEYHPKYLPDNYAEKYSEFLLQDGDVVIAMTDLASAPKILGVPTIIKTNGKNVLLNQRVGKLIIKDNSAIHLPYLQQALNYPKVREVYKNFAGGGLQINAGKADILRVKIPLPPLDEQKRIAAILDKADSLHRKRQQAMQLADEFLRAVFLELFGDPVKNPKGWDEKTLSDVVKDSTVITYGIVQAGAEVENGIPYIRTGDFKNGRLADSGYAKTHPDIAAKFERSKVNTGDLVYCIRASIGSVDIVPDFLDGANLTQGTAKISPGKNIKAEFLVEYLRTKGFKDWIDRYSKGATFKEITLATLRQAPVLIPPLDNQEKFVAIREKILKVVNKNNLFSNEKLFNSLSQKAFAGEL